MSAVIKKAQKYIYLLPLSILLVTGLNSVYVVSNSEYLFSTKHYMGFIFLVLVFLSIFINKNVGVYLTGLLLLAGTFNLIAFTVAIETYSFGFKLSTAFFDASDIGIKIQPYSFYILILHIAINYRMILTLIRSNSLKKSQEK